MLLLKLAVKNVLASPAGWRASALVRRKRCLVLAYHRIGRPGDRFSHVDADVFRRQLLWLSRHCTIIGPEELHTSSVRRNGRPHVLITFDDGYRDYYELAYPILKEFGVPAVNFLSTRYIDDGAIFWWDVVTLAVQACELPGVRLPWTPDRAFDLTTRTDRHMLSRACRLRISSGLDRDRDATLQEFCAALRVDPAALVVPRQVMTWDEVRQTMDLTRYGGHTHTHVRVSRVDPPRLEDEIRTCRSRMEAEIGTAPTLFAYPIGDSSEAAKEILPRYGFKIAFSILEGYADGDVDWLDVRRYPGPQTLRDLAWLAGGWASTE